MELDFVIIGGGIAGLSAAIRLTELGARPWLIEAGDYPSHKVCGEFFSPESLMVLKRWGICPISITHAHFHASQEVLEFRFPHPAGSLSHIECDPQLKARAEKGGAVIKTRTTLDFLDPHKRMLKLSTGKVLKVKNLILATGRIPQMNSHSPTPRIRYVGIKAHFEGLPIRDTLEMFSFKGAYLGISPIEKGKFNLACLARKERFSRAETPDALVKELRSENKNLDHLLSQGHMIFDNWMTAFVPELGLKKIPELPYMYFIGDAAGTIPPITGNGLSMGLAGGILAAEYAFRRDADGFRKAWKAHHRSQIFWGKCLHEVMMRPLLAQVAFKTSKLMIPSIPQLIFRLTRSR